MERIEISRRTVKYSIVIGLILQLAVMLQSCGKGEDELKGKWSASGDIGDSTDMRSWFITYEFEGRNYKMSGYPPISEEGSYEIIQVNGDSLLLYLDVVNSSPEIKDHKEWFVIKDSSLVTGQLKLKRTQ
ncbi:MAG TPA: hypothetical protein VG961_02465 [Ignavibacteria bacterium]|nr:hypothetical protein [Ignavibacteria bacterium]